MRARSVVAEANPITGACSNRNEGLTSPDRDERTAAVGTLTARRCAFLAGEGAPWRPSTQWCRRAHHGHPAHTQPDPHVSALMSGILSPSGGFDEISAAGALISGILMRTERFGEISAVAGAP